MQPVGFSLCCVFLSVQVDVVESLHGDGVDSDHGEEDRHSIHSDHDNHQQEEGEILTPGLITGTTQFYR